MKPPDWKTEIGTTLPSDLLFIISTKPHSELVNIGVPQESDSNPTNGKLSAIEGINVH
jgi:hypothetical protein